MPALMDVDLPAPYRLWINRHVRRSTCEGECAETTLAMVTALPELRRVQGFYFDGPWKTSHWWCVDDRARVIDPTRYQFRDKGRGTYLAT